MASLTTLILLPLAGALVAWFAGRRSCAGARRVALATALLQLGVTAWVTMLAWGSSGLVISEASGGVSGAGMWLLRLDGLSIPLVALTSLLGVVAVLASWKVSDRTGAHFALLLSLQAAVTLVFVADHVVLFYAAWEAVLIPMFFLIGGWGHEGRRHAAMKFFIYTFAGSALMLVGLLIVVFVSGESRLSVLQSAALGTGARTLVFWLLVAGFAVKIPVFPLHTWLPDAHVEAPTAGSIMLAGVLLKMGGYGFLRLALPVAPEAAHAAAPLFAALGVIGIVYGALMALAQSDLKRLVAYSSVSHMGFVVLAIAVGTPLALTAAMLTMVAHGLTAALQFLLVGLLYDRTHTRALERFGGLMRTLPVWGTAFVFAALASLGLPGLAGFPGELVTVLEGFTAFGWWIAIVAFGVVIAGAYALRAVRSVAQGPEREEWLDLSDLDVREASAVAPLAVALVVLGVWPGFVAFVVSPLMTQLATAMGRG